MRLVEVTEVKTRLDLAHDSHNQLLLGLIESASERIQTFLNRTMSYAEYTETLDGGVDTLFLKAPPVSSIVSVYESTNVPRAHATSGTLLTDADYILDATNGTLTCAYGEFPKGVQTVQVRYYGGYAVVGIANANAAALPLAIKHATIDQVVFMYRNRDNIGWTSVSAADSSVYLNEKWDLLPGVRSALVRFRRPI